MENASRNLKQAREECTHDDGGVEPGQTCPSRRSRREKDVPMMMEVVGPGQTCRWRLKEVEEDARARRDARRDVG
jgi:hypothetical protein